MQCHRYRSSASLGATKSSVLVHHAEARPKGSPRRLRAWTALLFGVLAPVLAPASSEGGEGDQIEQRSLVNSTLVKELRTRVARLGTSAGNSDTTFVGYTPGAPGAGGANYWSIYAGLGKDGYYRPYNGTPHKGNWNWEGQVNGDSLQGWWPLRDLYATTGGLTLTDRNRPWWAIDTGNMANYRINGSTTRTFGVIGVWHRDGGSNVPGPVLAPLWTPPSGSNAAWMGLRAHGDNSYVDAVTGNPFNENVIAYTNINAASASGNDAGFPGYASQMDQMLYRDINFTGKTSSNLTVRFRFQTVMSTGVSTTPSTRTGWFDCCPIGVTGGGGALPANQRNNFISASDAGDALAPRDSFMVYVGTGVEAGDNWADPTGGLNPVYDPQRRWFGEVLKWDRNPSSNPANPQPLYYKELLSVAGNWPAAGGFVDTTFVMPNAAIAPFLSANRLRLVFRVKTNRGFDDQGTAYSSGRKGAVVVDRVSYTLSGHPEVIFGDFEGASDINNSLAISPLNAWKSTGKPPATFDHPDEFATLVYEDLCGQKGDISRVCNMSGVVISAGDHDNSEAAGGLVMGAAEHERNNGIVSPTISFADNDGNPNSRNLHGLYGSGGNGGVGDIVAGADYNVVYDVYTGIMDPATKGNLWRVGCMAYPATAKAGYGYPAWGQLRLSPFLFNTDKQCITNIEGLVHNGLVRTSNASGIPDSLRIFLGKSQQCFRFGVSTGCSPTDGCYWDNVALAIADGEPIQLGVQIGDWLQDAFPSNETTGYAGVAALFDTTAALVKTGLNIAQTTNNMLRHCVPGDSVVITSSGTTARVDIVFRILPGPGNYQPLGRPDLGMLRRVPSSTTTVTKGDGSFWDEYRQVPGDFASPNAVVLHHNASGGWDPNVWNSARCDTAEVLLAALQGRGVLGGPATAATWMSTLHESDPHYNTLGVTKNVCYVRCLSCAVTDIRCDGGQPDDYAISATTTKEATKIIPDGLLTPGSHVEYFFRSQETVVPGTLSDMIPDTNVVYPQVGESSLDGHRWQQFGILPNRWKDPTYRHPVTRDFGAGPSCMLVVDHDDRRGNERVWVSIADSIGATPQRYWGAHNGWHAVGGGDLNDPANNRRGSDGQPGFVSEHLGQPGSGGRWDMYQVKAAESPSTRAGTLGSRLAYRNAANPLVSNKSSRQGPTPEMLNAYYNQLVVLTGDLKSGLLGPFIDHSQNDVGLLTSWLASGNTTAKNRGFWAIGDGFVESNWFAGSSQNGLLSNYLGVGLQDPNYIYYSGNTAGLAQLKVFGGWSGDPSDRLYGLRNPCTATSDVLALDGIGLTLGTATSQYQDPGGGSTAIGSVFKDWDASHPWKVLVDGWDLSRLTSVGDVNTLGRATYVLRTLDDVWANHCGDFGQVPDPVTSTCPGVVSVGPTGTCCFDVVVRDNGNNPIAGALVRVTFANCSVTFCPTQPPGLSVQGNSATVLSNAVGLAHFCVCATLSGPSCTASISVNVGTGDITLCPAVPVQNCADGATICGTQFYDANCSGTLQIPADVGIPGWPITLTSANDTLSTVTDSLGHYCFTDVPPGTYTLCSANYVGLGTTPSTPLCPQVVVGSGQAATVDFGICTKCDSSLLVNGNFASGLSPGWSAGYGGPTWFGGTGCDDPGYVRISGNKNTGSAIYQTLIAPTQVGKIYELRLCARLASTSALDYGKVRAVAFNGILSPSGTHPFPGTDLAIIGISAKINCTDWSYYTLHRWRASKNFSHIALSVDNNHGSFAVGLQSALELDNICFVEVGDTLPCYAAPLDTLGNPILPFGQAELDCPPLEDTLDVFMGSIFDLYGSLCPDAALGLDTWYDNPGCPDSCASLGGELPTELKNFILGDSLTHYLNQVGIDSLSQVMDSLLTIEDRAEDYVGSWLDTLFSLGAIQTPCDTIYAKGPPPQPNGPSPFQGRDIVFVHGYRTDPLGDRIMGVAGALKRWPADKTEFLDAGGYWKDGANRYWREHIRKYLKVDATGPTAQYPGGQYRNRFIVVAHPATQSGVVAVHAILWQIAQAMKDGTGVKLSDATDPRGTTAFGSQGFVIVSHSAGELFSNVSMSLAHLVGQTPLLNVLLGDITYIADRVDLHIALAGANAGSAYAPGLLLTATVPWFQGIAKQTLGIPESFPVTWIDHLPWLYRSQVLDMSIPQFIYGGELFERLCNLAPTQLNPACYLANKNFIEDVPMKVLTAAGGHPSSYGVADENPAEHNVLYQILAKALFHQGFDDGVVSLDGAAGNNDRRFHFPNRYLPSPGLLTATAFLGGGPLGPYDPRLLLNERVYDMGIALRRDNSHRRAIGNYLDQKLDVLVGKVKNDIACALGFGGLCITPPPPNPPLYELLYASAGAIPWLSPTGMVQPVLDSWSPGPSYDALKRFNNHYSFLQSTADHYGGSNYLDHTYDPQFPNYERTDGIVNGEEARVITDAAIYSVVKSDFKYLQSEYIRGHSIGGWCILKIGGKCRLKFPTLWIWKRKYHLLGTFEQKNTLDYIYDYVLRP